jgi:glycosyltransferase involved in cell wall biosynthesis
VSDGTGQAVACAKPSFVVFSDDWGEHPSSCQHLFRVIGRSHRVLWVNTIGMRNPKLTIGDLQKIRTKLRKMLRQHTADPTRSDSSSRSLVDVHVRQPFMLPFGQNPIVRRLNRASVEATLRGAAIKLEMNRPIVVSTVPNACDYLEGIDSRQIIYYCVDDFARWPGHAYEYIRDMEQALIQRSDTLIATSHTLYQRLLASGKPTHLLAHGVDLELFTREPFEEHPALQGIPHPRAGYFGLFDERSDQDLIVALARRMPDFSFVIAGPVAVNASRLRAHSNVYFTGALPYSDLPALVKGLQVLILPYSNGALATSISPLKLKEYLVTGKPIVATPIAEVLLQKDRLFVASDATEWEAALRAALSMDVRERRREVLQLLAGESWAAKASLFIQMCSRDPSII